MTEPAKFLTNDETYVGKTVESVAHRHDLNVMTLRGRLKKNPNTPIELLVYPANKKYANREKTYEYLGNKYTSSSLAGIAKCSISVMEERLARYPTVKDAVEAKKWERVPRGLGNKGNWDSKIPDATEDLELKRTIENWQSKGLEDSEIISRIRKSPHLMSLL